MQKQKKGLVLIRRLNEVESWRKNAVFYKQLAINRKGKEGSRKDFFNAKKTSLELVKERTNKSRYQKETIARRFG